MKNKIIVLILLVMTISSSISCNIKNGEITINSNEKIAENIITESVANEELNESITDEKIVKNDANEERIENSYENGIMHYALYSEMDDNSSVIAKLTDDNIQQESNEYTFEIIEEKLSLWYKVKSKNGVEGFIYRNMENIDELVFEDNQEVDFIYPDDTKEMRHTETMPPMQYMIDDSLAEVGYFVDYNLYEWTYGSVISIKTKEVTFIDSYLIPSINKVRFIVPHIIGYDNMSEIGIYSISEDGVILKEMEVTTFEWEPHDVKWVNDELIKLTRKYIDENGQYTEKIIKSEIIYRDEKWEMIDVHNK